MLGCFFPDGAPRTFTVQYGIPYLLGAKTMIVCTVGFLCAERFVSDSLSVRLSCVAYMYVLRVDVYVRRCVCASRLCVCAVIDLFICFRRCVPVCLYVDVYVRLCVCTSRLSVRMCGDRSIHLFPPSSLYLSLVLSFWLCPFHILLTSSAQHFDGAG